MLHTLQTLLAPAAIERLTLLVNHVLASETVATERLRPHAGRRLELQWAAWPSILPTPPTLIWRVTPAGLLEWGGLSPESSTDSGAELTLRLDASNPAAVLAKLLTGEPPPLQIDGDAQFASDISWLTQNLRWDLTADLERLFGPLAAQQLGRAGTGLAAALRMALRGAQDLGQRWRTRSAA